MSTAEFALYMEGKLDTKMDEKTRYPQFLPRLHRHPSIDDVSCDARALTRVVEVLILTLCSTKPRTPNWKEQTGGEGFYQLHLRHFSRTDFGSVSFSEQF